MNTSKQIADFVIFSGGKKSFLSKVAGNRRDGSELSFDALPVI